MDIELLINGKEPDPQLVIINGRVEEGINQVSLIELLAVSDYERTEEELEEMVGKSATLVLREPVNGELKASRFDGLIYEFHEPNSDLVEKDKYVYRLIIRPKVWKLNIGCNARSFPKKSRIQVISEVLEEYGLVKGEQFETQYYKETIYPKLSQILQCEVSDWVFIRRLMSEAGINFYFGATNDGEKEEMLMLVDNNSFFPNGYEGKIPWNTSSLMIAARHIESFETRVRAVPESVSATAALGDGLTKTFASQEPVPKGKGSQYRFFSAGGQEEQVAKQSAKVLAQGFESYRVTYEGESNHFLIRAGKRISIDGPSAAKQKKVLISSVVHRFHQGVESAFGRGTQLEYTNRFTAVKDTAEVRPVPSTRVFDARLGSSRAQPLLGVGETDANVGRACESAELPTSVQAELLQSLERLMIGLNGFGVMVGKVIEDAKTSEGNEATCKIENERFPEGLTIKVASPWLVPGGGVTALPRVGMQVYFMLVQGEGGGHEGVMLGYRPSGQVPGLNPAKQTETPMLKAGPKPELDKPAQPVVEKSSISPSNRQRNALGGEGGVCELAVIDGSDASMAMTANGAISLAAKGDTNMSSANHMHMADVANQQFGELTTGVGGDCTEAIGGNHQLSIMGNQDMFVAGNIGRTVSGNIEETVSGNKTGTISGNLENTISGNSTETVSGNKGTTVSGNNTTDVSGNDETSAGSNITMGAGSNLEANAGANGSINAGANFELGAGANISVSAGGEVKISGGSKVEISCGGGSLTIDAGGTVSINGVMVNVTGSGPVSVSGAVVKLNA